MFDVAVARWKPAQMWITGNDLIAVDDVTAIK